MKPLLDRKDIRAILPHRDPFLFVDAVIEISPGKSVTGLVRVADSGWFLAKDESGIPFFPPTLLTEAMAQVGAVLALYPEENRGRTIYFRSIENAVFHKRVPAGSALKVEGTVHRMRGRLGTLQVSAFLDGVLVAEGRMGFAL